MTEHKINPVVQIASPYENAQDKVLSPDEIRQIRSKLAWSKSTPILIDALYIHSTNLVSTRRSTRRYLEECQLAKENNEWVIKSGTRTDIQNVKTFE